VLASRPQDTGKVDPQAAVASVHEQSIGGGLHSSSPKLTVHPFVHWVVAPGTAAVAPHVYSVLASRPHDAGKVEPQAVDGSLHEQSSGGGVQVSAPIGSTMHPISQMVPSVGVPPAAVQVYNPFGL